MYHINPGRLPLHQSDVCQPLVQNEQRSALLGLGWLFKEGKLANDGEKVTLA